MSTAQQACRSLIAGKHCKFGDKCRFSHDPAILAKEIEHKHVSHTPQPKQPYFHTAPQQPPFLPHHQSQQPQPKQSINHGKKVEINNPLDQIRTSIPILGDGEFTFVMTIKDGQILSAKLILK